MTKCGYDLQAAMPPTQCNYNMSSVCFLCFKKIVSFKQT